MIQIPFIFLQSIIRKIFFRLFFNNFKKGINIYKVLGVSEDTSEEDIKMAIIKLINKTNSDNKDYVLSRVEEYFSISKDKRDLKYFDMFKFLGIGFGTETKDGLESNNGIIIKN